MLSRECWLTIGGLDLRTFERYGWGIDLDLAVRAREAGYGVYITEMAYINHFGHKTANATFGRRRYAVMANFAKVRGMRKLHGRQWRKHLPPGTLPPPPWRKIVASETYTSIPLGDDPVGQVTRDGRARAGPPDIDIGLRQLASATMDLPAHLSVASCG